MQKDDNSLLKQEEGPRLAIDGDGDQLHKKAAHSFTTSSTAFHRPFLDDENGSVSEKLCTLSGSEPPNGVCAPRGLFTTTVQKTPLCSGSLELTASLTEEAGDSESDGRGRCEGDDDAEEVKDEDGGRLNAALGLISLADVSSDVATDVSRLTSSAQTKPGNCSAAAGTTALVFFL